MNYVCGYMFSPDKSDVALVWKKRPVWQRGKLNGIGGKFESDDVLIFRTMQREFEEETGIRTKGKDWNYFAKTCGPSTDDKNYWNVYYFRAFSPKVYDVTSKTDEPIIILPVNQVMTYPQVTHNQWIIQMALHSNKGTVYTIMEKQCQN